MISEYFMLLTCLFPLSSKPPSVGTEESLWDNDGEDKSKHSYRAYGQCSGMFLNQDSQRPSEEGTITLLSYR